MTLIEHLISLAMEWSANSGRSLSALGTVVANDGKFFSRIQSGQRATTETFEKFLSFFRDPTNWRDGAIPHDAVALLDNFANVATEQGRDSLAVIVPSSGKLADLTVQAGEAA